MHGVQKREWWYPTAFSLWGEEEQAAVQRVVTSGRFTMGEEVEAFEAEFAAYHKMRHGIMVNSGSSANLIMVAALFNTKERPPLERHDHALVPAIAWSTTYAPLVQQGLRLSLMDADASWGPTGPYLEKARVAIGASILGVPALKLPELDRWCQANSVYFLEDNCEALGAEIHGKLCGTRGLMNSFSFFYSHQISAIEGGMILTNDDECARLCRILRAHGWTRDVYTPLAFADEYNFTHFGYNVRPLEMHAAVARVQLKRLPEFIVKRRANLKLFYDCTKDLPLVNQYARGLYTSPFGLAFALQSSAVRQQVVNGLRNAGIDCRLPTGGSFTLHPYGQEYRKTNSTPSADSIHQTGLFLGNAPYDISEKIGRACHILREVLT